MKKNHRKKKPEPSVLLALVALVVPVLMAGIVPTLAEGTGHPQLLFDYSLFDRTEFMQMRRLRNTDRIPSSSSSSIESVYPSAPMVSPCDQSTSSVSSVSSVSTLRYEDLTSTQRSTLRGQLRNRTCPQRADAAYLALCESILKALPALETRSGLRNPNQ